MSAALKKDYSMDDYKTSYHDITELYNQAEDLVATVENPSIKNQDAQLVILEPLINDVIEATDILSEEFILIAENKKNRAPSKFSKNRIEASLRKIFAAIQNYQQATKNIANIADVIVEKIKLQLDKVVSVFFEFVQISLQSIMGKAELEALRVRDARIALMMHQLSLAQHSG